jgi:hypothetical protein
MENPVQMDDLGTPTLGNIHMETHGCSEENELEMLVVP